MENRLSPTQTIIAIAGVVAFIASFLPWIDILGQTRSAWSDDLLFPLLAWPGILGGLMALDVLLGTFATVKLPTRLLGFNRTQILFIFAVFASLITASFLIGGDSFGIGFWLTVGACVGLLIGAVRLRSEAGA